MLAFRPLTVAALACALTLGGCSSSVDQLDGAIATIPIYNPAKFKERTQAFTSDVMSDMTKFSTYTWYLETESSAEDVASFYASQWPDAVRVEEDGEISLRTPPFPEDEDEPLGESVMVTIKTEREGGKTQFHISEDVFRARRR